MLSFNFGGKDSFRDYGIYISKRPDMPSPKRRITNVIIPGRSSSLKFDEDTYDDITISVECSIKDRVLLDRIDDIKGWLIGTGESDLIFNFQKEKKYVAQVVNAIDFSQVLRYFSKFIIIFNCQPFKYEVNSSAINLTTAGIINNIGSVYSEPIIKVMGIGDVTLTINTQTIKLKDISDHVILDSVQQNCYNEQLENLNNKMLGEFPILLSGKNEISWSGTISKLEVTPNWRWL